MKAMVYTRYGPPDVLQMQEVPRPSPGDDEVLVKVRASSINFGDLSFVMGKPFVVRLMGAGLLKPRYSILGSDVSGEVEAVGSNVKGFRPGQEVFGDLSEDGWGGFGEYVAAPASALAPKPANLSFEEAAAVPQAAVVALQGLRDVGRLRAGQKVLIVGASGGTGSYAVQIARAFGAEVTGVCSTRNVEMVRSLGAEQIIDYTREDFARNGQRYDLILTTAGYRSIFDYRRALSPAGTYVMSGGAMGQIYQALLLGPWLSRGGQRITNLAAKPSQADLMRVAEMIEAGRIKPVIDRVYPLSEAAEALRYYGERHSRGKVVVSLEEA